MDKGDHPMKEHIHREMTTTALGEYFSAPALEQVIAANLGQDALPYQIGHDHFHYDNNAFTAGDAYVAEQHQQVSDYLAAHNAPAARAALGRLTHTVQDFYAHSNYVRLWLDLPQTAGAAPETIDPLHPQLLTDPRLHSGKLYLPLEILYFIPPLQNWALQRLPRDSHAWMNLDSPERGDLFPLARAAAVERTRREFDTIKAKLVTDKLSFLTHGE
jgi:hypothetical protein